MKKIKKIFYNKVKIKSEIKIYSRTTDSPKDHSWKSKTGVFLQNLLSKTTEHTVWQKTGLHCRAHLLHFHWALLYKASTAQYHVSTLQNNMKIPFVYILPFVYTHTCTQTISEKIYMELVTLDASGEENWVRLRS